MSAPENMIGKAQRSGAPKQAKQRAAIKAYVNKRESIISKKLG